MKKFILFIIRVCMVFLLLPVTGASAQDTVKVNFSKAVMLDTAILKVQENVAGNDNNNIKQKNIEIDSIKEVFNSIRNSISALTKKKNKTEQDFADIKNKYDSLSGVTNTLKKSNSDLDSIINAKKNNISNIDSLITKKQKEIEIQNKNVDTLKAMQAKEQTTIQGQQAVISRQLDSLEVISKIEMRDFVLIRYSNPKTVNENDMGKNPAPKSFKVKINEISINVHEGIILEIIVRTDSGTFRNKDAVIDLMHFGERGKHERLFIEHQDFGQDKDYSYIFLDDAVKYSPIRSYTDVVYGDFEITLLPTDDARTYFIRESTSINTYFNVAAFTDIKGIGDEPNGIAQFTAEAKFITNTRNCANSGLVLFNYLSFCGGLSKFDNSFKQAELFNHDSISRKDLLQRSNYSIGMKLNILKGFLPPTPAFLYNSFEINAGYNFVGTKIFDTSFKTAIIIDTSFRNVTQNQFYIEPIITLSRHRNFSMSVALPFYFNSVKESAGISNSSMEYWAAPGISLMYFGKRDTGSKLFFRYNHFINLKDKTQAFAQIQLGYSVNLTEVWNNSSSK